MFKSGFHSMMFVI